MDQPPVVPEAKLSTETIEAIAMQIVAMQPPAKRDYLAIWLPLVGVLLGAVIGGLAPLWVNSRLEPEKQRLPYELGAYSDFAKAEAAWILRPRPQQPPPQSTPAPEKATPAPDPTKEEREINLKIRDAAFRIVIFSSSSVIEALATFIRSTPREACDISSKDIAIYQKIRLGILGSNAGVVSNADIAMTLFGCGYTE